MKTFFKVLAAVAVLAGIFLAVAAYLQRSDEPDYIQIYGDDDTEE